MVMSGLEKETQHVDSHHFKTATMGANPFRILIQILNLILRHTELEASQHGHWPSFVGQGS